MRAGAPSAQGRRLRDSRGRRKWARLAEPGRPGRPRGTVADPGGQDIAVRYVRSGPPICGADEACAVACWRLSLEPPADYVSGLLHSHQQGSGP